MASGEGKEMMRHRAVDVCHDVELPHWNHWGHSECFHSGTE